MCIYLRGMFCICVCFIFLGCKFRVFVYKLDVWFFFIIFKFLVIGFNIMSDKMDGISNVCNLVWFKKWILFNFLIYYSMSYEYVM